MSNTPAPSAAEQAVIDRFDATPVPPEVVMETVARALWEAQPEYSVSPWDEISETTRERYRAKAAAAIAALPPSPAELAVKRVEALAEGWSGSAANIYRKAAKLLRAALASPAPAPQEQPCPQCGTTTSVHDADRHEYWEWVRAGRPRDADGRPIAPAPQGEAGQR